MKILTKLFLFSFILLMPLMAIDPVQSYINKISEPVIIDGILDDWNHCFQFDLNLNTVGNNGGIKPIPGKYEVCGTVMVMYDEVGMYIAAIINDDTPGFNENLHSYDVWNGDCIELFMGNYDIGNPPSLHPEKIDTLGKLDHQYIIGYNANEEVYVHLIGPDFQEWYDYPSEEYFKVIIKQNQAILEGYIDFSIMEASPNGQYMSIPEVGSIMPFYINVIDMDTYHDGGDFTLLGYGHNPYMWGDAQWDLGLEVVDIQIDSLSRSKGQVIPYNHPFARKIPDDYDIVIDGDLFDWNICFPFNMNDKTIVMNQGFLPVPGSDEISAVGKFMWDDEGLYFGFEITDDAPGVNDYLYSNNINNGDCIEILLGNYDIGSPPSIHESFIDTLGKLDHKYTIGYDFDGNVDVFLWGPKEQEWNQYPVEENCAVKIDSNNVILEGYLDFMEMEASPNGQYMGIPGVGSVIPLYINVIDVDSYENGGDLKMLGYGHNPDSAAGGQWDLGLTITEYSEKNLYDPVGPNSIYIEDENYAHQVNLIGNYPNPFNPTTNIRFEVNEIVSMKIEVFDIRGCKIKTLVSKNTFTPGFHQVVWDGTDRLGRPVASGVYLYKLKTAFQQTVKRMLLVR